MRSSTGAHFIALDHVRALAAFMVFTWHFIHDGYGYPVVFNYIPALFPLCLLDEGHTGVALFMVLSGYLFAKLLNGKSISYPVFLWNRILRLLPLLALVVMIAGVKYFGSRHSLYLYFSSILRGVIFPTLPNGGWSITVEFHFYLILPLFLGLVRKSKWLPFSLIIAAIALRFLIYHQKGEVHYIAYWTILGRIDQFGLGILAYQFRACFAHRHVRACAVGIGFAVFYWCFDSLGGFLHNPSYPSTSSLWIIIPTVEGLTYGVGIAWYDGSFNPPTTGFSGLVGRLGEYSYSIYLLHFFIVFAAAQFVNERIMHISNFYLACGWSVICFVAMIVPGYLSFRFVEAPFLKLRGRYIKAPSGRSEGVIAPATKT